MELYNVIKYNKASILQEYCYYYNFLVFLICTIKNVENYTLISNWIAWVYAKVSKAIIKQLIIY